MQIPLSQGEKRLETSFSPDSNDAASDACKSCFQVLEFKSLLCSGFQIPIDGCPGRQQISQAIRSGGANLGNLNRSLLAFGD